jgi:hypothetical protein
MAHPITDEVRYRLLRYLADHRLHDRDGGRLVGKECNFGRSDDVFLAGSHTTRVNATALPDGGRYRQDNFVLTIDFANRSVASITYVASGDRRLGKESFELFRGRLSARLDNFASLSWFGTAGGLARETRFGRTKAIEGYGRRSSSISLVRVRSRLRPMRSKNSMRTTFAARESLMSGFVQVGQRIA